MTPIAEATMQAAALSALSNLLAQFLKCYTQQVSTFAVDYAPLLRFALFALLSTPPNFLWQLQLEAWFPSHVPTLALVRDDKVQAGEKEDVKTKLSVANTLAKFATDQLAGGPVNTVLFLAFMGYARGLAGPALLSYVKQEFWPLIMAGLKVWPAVSLLAFSVVPPHKRVVFGNAVALGWNVFLGLTM